MMKKRMEIRVEIREEKVGGFKPKSTFFQNNETTQPIMSNSLSPRFFIRDCESHCMQVVCFMICVSMQGFMVCMFCMVWYVYVYVRVCVCVCACKCMLSGV